jgi:hypothetical protein
MTFPFVGFVGSLSAGHVWQTPRIRIPSYTMQVL